MFMALRRKYDIVIIVLLVLAALAYASFSSGFRLQAEMPVQFFDGSHLPPAKRSSDEKIAKAYWDCAVKQVQWKYGYASRLPDDPPPEFGVSATEVGPVAKDEAIRRHYWQQLRATWHISTVWKTEYLWSSVSFRQSLRSAGAWWSQAARDLFGQ
jgi:hypothetical protein